MPKQKQAFYHEDISVLAKSLKTQLSTLGKSPGHVEILNILARTTGHQNYQSWSAATPANEELVEGTVRLEYNASTMEVFGRDRQGRIIDRRHEQVERVFVLVDLRVWVRPKDGLATGTVRVKASLAHELMKGHENEEPERWFLPYVPKAFAEWIEREPATFTLFGSIDLSLDRYVENDIVMRRNDMQRIEHPLRVPPTHAARLLHESEQAKAAITRFEQAKAALWDLFSNGSPTDAANEHRQQIVGLVGFLKEYLEVEGDMFMGAWNREKFGHVVSLLERAMRKPGDLDLSEWDFAKRDVYSASAPKHWLKPVASLQKYSF